MTLERGIGDDGKKICTVSGLSALIQIDEEELTVGDVMGKEEGGGTWKEETS